MRGDLQLFHEFGQRRTADDLSPLAVLRHEFLHRRGGAVPDRDAEAVVLHVQHQVLAHHFQAAQSDIAECGHWLVSQGGVEGR